MFSFHKLKVEHFMPKIYTLKNPAYRERRDGVASVPFKQWVRDNAPVVAVLRPPSRVKSKKDKHAVQMHRIHGTHYRALPDFALRNVGHVNRFSDEIQTTRQF